MLRLIMSLVLITTLAFGQGGHKSAGNPAGTGNCAAIADIHHVSRVGGEQRGTPLHGCHHVPCPQTYLPDFHFLLIPQETCSEIHLVANEHDWRNIILDRDPPIPRSST